MTDQERVQFGQARLCVQRVRDALRRGKTDEALRRIDIAEQALDTALAVRPEVRRG